jgi:tRNA nucleotidyltransferase/poly(A) polymerase
MWSGQVAAAIQLIEEAAGRFGVVDAFFVGGYPRALAMGQTLEDVHDLDVASASADDAATLGGIVAEQAKSEIESHHRTRAITVGVGAVEVDFQGPESHDKPSPWMHLWGVEDTPLARNIFDRDFTMNALAIPLGGNEIKDLTRRGMPDIMERRIASIIPPEVSVPTNPLMITRAIKFKLRYGFKIDPALWRAMTKYAGKLKEELTPRRLSIEAHVLSRYPESKEILRDIGLAYLVLEDVIEMGRRSSDE